jgi:hypothetical protein
MGDRVAMRQPIPEEWTKRRGLISEQAQSGERGAVFCRERGLPVWQFYAWKKRLGEAPGAKFVEVEVKPARAGRVELRGKFRSSFFQLTAHHLSHVVVRQGDLLGSMNGCFHSQRRDRFQDVSGDGVIHAHSADADTLT